jgi:hypothetical protein
MTTWLRSALWAQARLRACAAGLSGSPFTERHQHAYPTASGRQQGAGAAREERRAYRSQREDRSAAELGRQQMSGAFGAAGGECEGGAGQLMCSCCWRCA